MMNPLSRKMFRNPMASRMPQGILASSAPMMTAAQKAMAKKQPMKAQTGASVNTQNYMSAIAQLTQQGDVQTLTNILQDSRLPTRVRTAARDAIGSLQPKPRNIGPQVPPQVGPPMASIPSIQGPPAVTVPGYSVGTDGAVLAGLTDDQLAARMMAQRQSDLEAGVGKPMPIIQALTEPTLGEGLAKLPTAPGTSRIGRVGDFLTKLVVSTARAPYDVTKQTLSGGSSVYDYLTEPYYTEEDVAAIAKQFADAEIGGKGGQPVESYERGRQETAGPREIVFTEGDFTDTGVEENGAPKAEDITPAFTNDILAQLDPNSGLSQEERDIRAQSIGADLTTQGKKIIDSDLSPKQKSTNFDKLFGIEGTYEERVEKRKDFLKNLLGERSKDIRTDINYNLMMTGLLIAAGESPDAMTNLAKGAAAGLAGYGEAAGEEREAARREETAVALQAVSEIGEEDARVKALKAQEAMGISAGDVAFEREKLLAEQQAQAAKTEAQKQRDFLAHEKQLDRIASRLEALIAADAKTPTVPELALDIQGTDSFANATMGMSVEDQTTLALQQASRILNMPSLPSNTSSNLLSFATQDEARAALSKMDTLPSQVIIGGQIIPVGTK